MSAKFDFPIIAGEVTRTGNLRTLQKVDRECLWHEIPGQAAIYQIGSRNDNQASSKDRNDFFLVYGRVYAPFRLAGQRESATERVPELFRGNPKDIDASAVFLSLRASGPRCRLRLSTDKYGFRPVFYLRTTDSLVFSTHMAGLRILLGGRMPGMDGDALLHYYHFGFTPNDRTLFEGVRKLPPGSTLEMTDGQVRVTRYFDVLDLYRPHAYAARPEAEICAAIDRRLDRSVRLRAGTSGPVGIALSGGVDSGYIAQKLVHGGAAVRGYNLAYEGHYDEFKRVDRLADLLGITVRKISLAADEILENYTAASAACSEPVGFNNATMRFAALAAQKDGVRTLFDGDGADRLFLGMYRYLLYRKLLRAYGLLDKAGAAGLAARLLGHVPHTGAKKLAIHFRNWNAGFPPYPERTMGATDSYCHAHERAVYRIAVERFAERFPDAAGKAGEGDFGPFFALVSIQMCPEMFFHQPAEIQAPLGLCPAPAYWDDDLVSLAISLPTGWKLKNGKTKYILRQAAAANVDPQYWMLPKIGLQDSFSFVMRSGVGRVWRAARREEVRESEEYGLLRSALPGGRVQADRLIGLVVWKAQHG